VAFQFGQVTLAAGAEVIFGYQVSTPPGIYMGPRIAAAAIPMTSGTHILFTGQGLRNQGPTHDPFVEYTYRVKNVGATGSFRLVGGGLT
jgi:hypothetical protein